MKIAWLSSWPPRHCGIATYSVELIGALQHSDNDVHVICHPDGGRPGEKNVYPVMSTEEHGWDEAVYDTVQKIDPDVVHIQHEYGLYQTSGDHGSGLFRLLFRLNIQGKYPAVVSGLEGLKAEAEASAAAIAVTPGDREALKRAILMLMGDASLRKQYARRARIYVKNRIDWTKTAKKHMQIYKKALGSKRRGIRDPIAEAML